MHEEVKAIVAHVLQLGDKVDSWTVDTPLLGRIPELDSMAVVAILTSLEDTYGFVVEDDEISAETFATLGTLTGFVERKLND